MSGSPNIAWAPQPGPQHALINCPLPLVFFGGARGGGKTDGVLGKWGVKAMLYGAAFNAIGFRRTTVSFEDAIERARELYIPCGAKFKMSGNRPTFEFPGGGRIGFRFLETVNDANEYQGRNLTDAWVEEAGQYPSPDPIFRLFGVLRSAAGVPVQMILTANPGGAGQHWLRDMFQLYPFPAGPMVLDIEINEGRVQAAVIPSRIGDNRVMLANDPGYLDRLRMVGSAELVRAWLEGDWSAIEGAFFSEWDSQKHVIAPFDIPDDWLRFRSMDWGFAAPFSVGWWAVAGDDFAAHGRGDADCAQLSEIQRLRVSERDARGRVIPRGALVRYREWYGASGPQKGIRITAEEIAAGIIARSGMEKFAFNTLDPSAFASDGGPSIAERMLPKTFDDGTPPRPGIVWRRADNKRVSREGSTGGWDQMRSRLRGQDGVPMLYVFDTCKDFIRTVPVLQHDPLRAEDLDTEAEDHVADEARYACMSRPYVPRAKPPPPKADTFYGDGSTIHSTLTINELIKRQGRQ